MKSLTTPDFWKADLQDELAQQLLEDIQNELGWQETLSREDIDISILQKMAQSALIEDREGHTEARIARD
jgi:hypothetical protein